MAYWPQVVAAVVTTAPTLPEWAGVDVFDGPPVTGSAPNEYALVGYVPDEDAAGSYGPADAPYDAFTGESGEVRGQIVARSGGTDPVPLRTRVCDLFDSLAAHVAADRTLGVLPADAATSVSASLATVQSSAGAVVRLTFTLTYSTRI